MKQPKEAADIELEAPLNMECSDTKKVEVLGAKAPTVQVPNLLNSFPRLLLKHGGSLRRFLFSAIGGNAPSSDDQSTSLRPPKFPWPMPMPYPEVFRSCISGQPNWRKRRTNLQVLVLSWLVLDRPSVAPPLMRLGMKLSSEQWSIVKTLQEASEDGNSLDEVTAPMMGRAAPKAELSSREVAALHRACAILNEDGKGSYFSSVISSNVSAFSTHDVGGVQSFGELLHEIPVEPYVAAKPIIADRIKFGDPPQFNPVPFMDGKTARIYLDPDSNLLPDDEVGALPSVSVRASLHEKLSLFRKMASCGRLAPLNNDIDTSSPGGLFAVGKDMERDRLILDRRPRNGREMPHTKWVQCMASGTLLSHLHLLPEECLEMSGQDVKDFFYQFVVSKRRIASNVLAGELTVEQMQDVFGTSAQDLQCSWAGLSTLAMGDLLACEFAQSAHLGLLLQSSAVHPQELLQLKQPVPRGAFCLGVVIDDLVMLEKVNRTVVQGAEDRLITPGRMSRAVAAYEQANLPLNASKAFDRALVGSFWGIEVDGEKGIVRAASARFWPLVLITIRVVSLGVCTLGLLESMVGSWLSILIVKRRLLCLMDEVYKALHAGGTPGTILRLSDSMKDELLVFCILGSLAAVNIRASILPTVFCTDASNWGYAAVSAEIPQNVAIELARHCLTKPMWTKLLPPAKAWLKAKSLLSAADELPGEEVYDLHPLWETVIRILQFVEIFRCKHSRRVHINIGELRGFLALERRLCRQFTSFRWLEFLDSQVCLGALVKGRSASPALNRELARNVPYILGADATSLQAYVSSKLNPADAPTRHAVVPEPDWSEPGWWASLAEGRFEEFDAWLNNLPLDVSGIPDFRSLGYSGHPLQSFWTEYLDSQASTGEIRNHHFVQSKQQHKPVSFFRNPAEHAECVNSTSLDDSEAVLGENGKDVVAILEQFPLQQFFYKGDKPDLTKRGALDLYSGRAGVAKALVARGCPWVLSFEWKRSAAENLLEDSLQNKLLHLIGLKAFRLVGSAIG